MKYSNFVTNVTKLKILKNNFIAPCNPACSYCFLNYTDVLKQNSIFSNISPEEIGQIIRNVHHHVKNYEKDEIIAYQGDEYSNLCIIVKGSVVGEISDFEGKTLRIEELTAPDTIATAFLFGKDNRLPVTITSTENTRLLIIPKNDFIRLFKNDERILLNYLNIISNRAQHLAKKIRLLNMRSIHAKIAHYLLEELKSSKSDTIRLKNTQNELSEMFGVARPSFSRILRELHHRGIIEARGKDIKILNQKALSFYL